MSSALGNAICVESIFVHFVLLLSMFSVQYPSLLLNSVIFFSYENREDRVVCLTCESELRSCKGRDVDME